MLGFNLRRQRKFDEDTVEDGCEVLPEGKVLWPYLYACPEAK